MLDFDLEDLTILLPFVVLAALIVLVSWLLFFGGLEPMGPFSCFPAADCQHLPKPLEELK